MLAPILLFMPFLQVQTALPNSLAGSWDNQDSSTMGITEIVLDNNARGNLQAHLWGKCEPSDCDWGVAEVHSSNAVASTVFDAGFAKTHVEFVLLPDGRLLVVSKSEYKDRNEVRDHDHVEFFVREDHAAPDPESFTAKALLKKVAETYRNLPAARFEAEEFVEHLGRLNTRKTALSKIAVSQPGKLRMEITGSGERRILISNGKTRWTFFPESNEYTSVPAGDAAFPVSILGSYALLDQVRGPARITGVGRVGETDCTIVTLGSNDDHRRMLWIDFKTNFVRKEESKDISLTEGGKFSQSSVTTFSVARTVDNLDAALFSFDPSKAHASERMQLQKDAPATSIGSVAPDFVLPNLQGKEVRLSDLRGKVVILDFWATWCPSCRSAMPDLELIHRQFRDKGLVVLGIDDESPEEQSAFLRKFEYSIASLVDSEKKIGNLYHVGGIPTTILIGADGKITAYDVGEATYESLWGALQALGEFRQPFAD
jgi:peroxiredoxin/outer membrane lipoprotein-sorting protein